MIHFIDKPHQLEGVKGDILSRTSWGCDSETTGLDAHKDKVILFQIGNKENQYVIDTRKVSLEPLRPFLESREHKKVFHNGKFDYKMVRGTSGIEIEEIRDTFLAERCLQAGRRKWGFGLDKVTGDRLGISMNKEIRKSFIGHKGDFSQDQIKYSAEDVAHMIPLCQDQIKDLEKEGLINTWLLESSAVQAFGDMEFNGLLLNKEAWNDIREDNLKKAQACREEMDKYAKNFFPVSLFDEVDINYGSPDQMLKLLRAMKVQVPVTSSRGGTTLQAIEDTSDATLKTIKKYPIVEQLKKYRSAMVRVNTFGSSYIDAVHPATGRIHFVLNQCGTDTGRPAKASDSPINPLNTPKDKVFRNAFIAEPDWTVETDDYAGCELRIWAEASGDPALREAFDKGMDVHCMVASRLYGKDVQKDNEWSHLRLPAKALNFGICYGMGPRKLFVDVNAMGMEVTFQEAKHLFRRYTKEEFKTGVDYVREMGRAASEEGVLTSISGRKRYWNLPDPENKEKYPEGIYDTTYRGRLAAIGREGGNFPMQSVNACMTKRAMVGIRDHIKKAGIRSLIINQVYDEVVTTTHKDEVEEFHPIKQKIMLEAAHFYLKHVKMQVDGDVLPFWTK